MYGRGIRESPTAHFAFPGPLRDRLVAAVLSGEKTATSSLLLEYHESGEELPEVGGHSVVVDSANQAVCEIETTEVRVLRLGDVDDQFARDEGEGFESVAEWRAAHEAFWQSPELLAAVKRPALGVDDETLVVAERFRVVKQFG